MLPQKKEKPEPLREHLRWSLRPNQRPMRLFQMPWKQWLKRMKQLEQSGPNWTRSWLT